jgi:hypothetical protein
MPKGMMRQKNKKTNNSKISDNSRRVTLIEVDPAGVKQYPEGVGKKTK